MSAPKVSVLMPAYNTAPYLKEAVNSILNQTLKEMELIIVDDGSTDNTLEIIQDFALRDSRIKYYHQENKGLSMTRNYALSKATGEYVYFMDSDDILVNTALESCYNRASTEGLEIVTFDADSFTETGAFGLSNISYIRKGRIDESVHSGIDMALLLVGRDLFRSSACLLFIKRSLLTRSHLRFYPGIIHEDELFTPLLFINARRVSYIPQVFFLRRVRENSIMTGNFSQKNINGYFTVVRELKKSVTNSGTKASEVISSRIGAIVNSVA